MKKVSKEIELSAKALGSAMFMATVCLYIAICAVFTLLGNGYFYFHISFTLLIQGLIASMAASVVWVIYFGVIKKWGFFKRYASASVISTCLFVISMLLPIINSSHGYMAWLISGLFSTLAFGTAIAVLSEKRFRRTNKRSSLLWEL